MTAAPLVLTGPTGHTCAIYHGNAVDVLGGLAPGSVNAIVTSPPYWSLRRYNGVQTFSWPAISYAPMPGLPPLEVPAQEVALGLEATPEAYIAHLLYILRACERVLHRTGVVFWNLGDSYASGKGTCHNPGGGAKSYIQEKERFPLNRLNKSDLDNMGLRPGSLVGIPWRFLFAAEAAGWLGRSATVWAKGLSGQGAVEDLVDQAAQEALGWGTPAYERMVEAFAPYVGNCMPESCAGWRWERCRVKVKAAEQTFDKYSAGSGNKRLPDASGGCVNAPSATWQACPGCPRCQDAGGYVLRRGSWRPTSSYELWFMLAHTGYFADGEDVKEESIYPGDDRKPYAPGQVDNRGNGHDRNGGQHTGRSTAGRNLRNVLAVPTSPNSLAFCPSCRQLYNARNGTRAKGRHCPECGKKFTGHYASYNRAVIRPWIASTPQQVCAVCGEPWARVVEKATHFEGGSGRAGTTPEEIVGKWGDERHGKNILLGPCTSSATLGFRPTCACQAESRPAVILDPFAGTGTTAIEALAQGRDVILVDASAEYCEIAAQNVAYWLQGAKIL